MKTCNLNNLINFELNMNVFEKYVQLLTDNYEYRIKRHEINCLIEMLNILYLSNNGAENFYFSYNIPHLGKEFDLIKYDNESIINIELKSTFNKEKIIYQLKQNEHYLSFLPQKNKIVYCFCLQNKAFYRLNNFDLIKVEAREVNNEIEKISLYNVKNINEYFNPVNYLISPLNNPDLFLSYKYYLTPQQANIKKDILKLIDETHTIAYVKGKAGTGKTLLLYDLARYISMTKKVCIVHCGSLCEGHCVINDRINNLTVIEAKQANMYNFSEFDTILIDESHRIYENTLKHILDYVKAKSINCIMMGDENQKLSVTEHRRNIFEIISLCGCSIHYQKELTSKIRINHELANFIELLFDNSKTKRFVFTNVDIVYAKDQMMLKERILQYKSKGYKYISYTPSYFKASNLDSLDKNNLNTHKVIGQEFDNVIVHIDNNFYYDSTGKLKSKPHPNPDYIYEKLLYQALTRARLKIAIIIVNDEDLLMKIMSILLNENR